MKISIKEKGSPAFMGFKDGSIISSYDEGLFLKCTANNNGVFTFDDAQSVSFFHMLSGLWRLHQRSPKVSDENHYLTIRHDGQEYECDILKNITPTPDRIIVNCRK